MTNSPTHSGKSPSAVTAASNTFVATHLADATALGERLAKVVQDPGAFVATIFLGFQPLADPVHADRLAAENLRRIAS
jgi:hypothetical protein